MKTVLVGLMLASMSFVIFAADKLYELTTAESGVVKQILVKPGEKVKQGQLLLQLDQSVIKANLELAKKAVISSTKKLDEVRKELERTEELYDRTVISDHELELAKVAFASAETELSQAQRDLAQAEYQLEYSQITAPLTGKIKSISAWEGMVVNNQMTNTVLITMER